MLGAELDHAKGELKVLRGMTSKQHVLEEQVSAAVAREETIQRQGAEINLLNQVLVRLKAELRDAELKIRTQDANSSAQVH